MNVWFVQVLRKHYPFKCKDHWVGILKKAAYAPTTSEFQEHMNTILTELPKSAPFIMNADPSHWANAAFPGERWGVVNNNLAESWNSWVLVARNMGACAMLDEIRKKIMHMMLEKREAGAKMVGVLCPEPAKILNDNYMASGMLEVQRTGAFMFEVREAVYRSVDVGNMTCSCGYWQLLRIPCKHACACIEKIRGDLYEYCDPCYRVESYKKTYDPIIYPMATNSSTYTDYDLDEFIRAPDVRAQPGRRKTARYPSQVEGSNTRCSLCKRRGHNRRTCKEAHVVA